METSTVNGGLFYFAFDPFDHFLRHVAAPRASQRFSPTAPVEPQQKTRSDTRRTEATVERASTVERRNGQLQTVLHFGPNSGGVIKSSTLRRGTPPQHRQRPSAVSPSGRVVTTLQLMESPRGMQGAEGDEDLPLDSRHELKSVPVAALTSSRRAAGIRASSTSPSPELVVAEEDNADRAKRFAPQLDPRSERLARIADEKRLASLRHEGHLASTTSAAAASTVAATTAALTTATAASNDEPLPRWLVLHHLAAQSSQKRAEAKATRDLERDEQEAAELRLMQSERVRLREALLRRSHTATASAHQRDFTSATVSSGNVSPGGRTHSPGSAAPESAAAAAAPTESALGPTQEIHSIAGAAQRKATPRDVPEEVAEILAARLETNVLVPLRGSHGKRPPSDGDAFSRKVSGASYTASDAADRVSRHSRVTAERASNGDAEAQSREDADGPPGEAASPSPKRPLSANAAASSHPPRDAACYAPPLPVRQPHSGPATSATTKQTTYRKQVMVEETFSFHPQITRGPHSKYYESRGLVERVAHHGDHRQESATIVSAGTGVVEAPLVSGKGEQEGAAAEAVPQDEEPRQVDDAHLAAQGTSTRPQSVNPKLATVPTSDARSEGPTCADVVVAAGAAPLRPSGSLAAVGAVDENTKSNSSVGRFSTDRGVSPPTIHSFVGGDNDELQQVFLRHPQQTQVR